jgi:hypothetical protein
MGLKVPAIVADAKKALEDGHCVVIGLQTTGEVSCMLTDASFIYFCSTGKSGI